MKNKITSIIIITTFLLVFICCKSSFFEALPPGQAGPDKFYNKEGINRLLIGAYSLLDGIGSSTDGGAGPLWNASVSNFIYGDVSADDGSFDANSANFDKHIENPTSGELNDKWSALFDGVHRSNTVLNTISLTKGLADSDIKGFTAQTRFLRGFYYFELRKIFKKVPFVDEKATDTRLPNTQEIWPKIEEDLKFAADNLPEHQDEIGRVNSWAAKAFLAKAYMFQEKYAAAKVLLDDIIANGKTSNDLKYDLNDCFRDAFDIDNQNSKEAVFSVQMSVNDGSPGSENGNFGDVQNHPVFNDAGTCCGADRPTINLVNAFKTDAAGLPLFDTFNDVDLKNDLTITSSDPFTPDNTTPLDPRLDWTAGRRGIPYLDWGLAPGFNDWTGGYTGYAPYWPVKSMFRKTQKDKSTATNSWTSGQTSQNYTIIRFADVLLWAAECEIEIGDMEKARDYINKIRLRAKNGCYVMAIDNNGKPTNIPAANYQIGIYTTSFPDKAYARKAVQFERRLELAMEGHRFFDLVRWKIADAVINKFLLEESSRRPILKGFTFQKGKSEYFPIPQPQILNSFVGGKPTLEQNPNY